MTKRADGRVWKATRPSIETTSDNTTSTLPCVLTSPSVAPTAVFPPFSIVKYLTNDPVCVLFYSEMRRVGNEVQLPELVSGAQLQKLVMKPLCLMGQNAVSTVILRKFEDRPCEQVSCGIVETFYCHQYLGCFTESTVAAERHNVSVTRLAGLVVKIGRSARTNITQCTWWRHLSQKTDQIRLQKSSRAWPGLSFFISPACVTLILCQIVLLFELNKNLFWGPPPQNRTVLSKRRPRDIFRAVSAGHGTSVLENPDIIRFFCPSELCPKGDRCFSSRRTGRTSSTR